MCYGGFCFRFYLFRFHSFFVCDGVNELFRPKMKCIRVCEVKTENVKYGTKRLINTYTPVNQSMDMDMGGHEVNLSVFCVVIITFTSCCYL